MKPYYARLLWIVSLTMVGSGCNDSDGLGFHLCERWFEPSEWDWQQLELYLFHTDPNTCPRNLVYFGEHHDASGTVQDRGNPDFTRAVLKVENYNLELMGYDEEYFLPDPISGWSTTQHHVIYPAGTYSGYPDYARYELGPSGLFFYWGTIEIRYSYQGG